MKRILLIAAVLFSGTSFGQTLHYDSLKSTMPLYSNIQPVKVRRTDTVNAIRLYCKSIDDNLRNKGQLYYELVAANGDVLDKGNFDISAEDYELWDAESKYLFTYLAKANNLNLTLSN